MPNNIIKTGQRPSDLFVNATSRYADSESVYYGSQKLLAYQTYKRNTVPTTPDDKYTVISAGWEFRPDLVSQNIYGVPDFWYKIMEANNIMDIMDFTSGRTIRIPNQVF